MPEINVLRERLNRRLSIFEEFGGLSSIVVQNQEWLYMLSEETRNSLSIEGHFASETELKAVIEGKKSYPEVLNYFNTSQSAYDLALQQHREHHGVFAATYDIKHIHSELFRGISDTRGSFRNGSIIIQRAKVKPPSEDLSSYMSAFVDFCRRELEGSDDLVRSLARIHTMFESIHPFRDGNGRAGRILMNYLAVGRGLPAIIIKGIGENDRDAYYKALERADSAMHVSFPGPSPQAFGAALDAGDSSHLEELMYNSLIPTIEPLIASALERKEPLLDFDTLATRMSVKESTMRKWRQRGQLIAIRRGRKSYSHPLLYLGELGLESASKTKERLQTLTNELTDRVHHVSVDSDGRGVTFFAGRVTRLYFVNVAPRGEPAQYALFLHTLILDSIDLGQPVLEDAPHINVAGWTDDEIADYILFPPVDQINLPQAYATRLERIQENHLYRAFYPLVSTLGHAQLIVCPVKYVATRLQLVELRRIVSQVQQELGDAGFLATNANSNITNIEHGIMGIRNDGESRDVFAFDASGLYSSLSLFPGDTHNDHLDSPNRNIGVAYAIGLISSMVHGSRFTTRKLVKDASDLVLLSVTVRGLMSRPLVDDTHGLLRLESRPSGREDSVDLSLTLTVRMLEAMADEIVVECARRLFWILNHEEITVGAIVSIYQHMQKGLMVAGAWSRSGRSSNAEGGATQPELHLSLRIGERQPTGYFLTGEVINVGLSTAKDIRAALPRLPPLVRPELRSRDQWAIRLPYDSPTLGGDYLQQGVVEFSDGQQVYRQEAVVDLSLLPGGSIRGYKVVSLSRPSPVDGYSIPG